jgi:hypothetical protein
VFNAVQPEISINCDRHHGMICLGSHNLQHGWGQPEPKAFVPGLWKANGSHADCARKPKYSELRTYGCRECAVRVTEGRAPGDEREDRLILRE